MNWAKVTVICFLICVNKCTAMSVSELEEFSNFLEKTARLDETLKKGTNSDDDYDQDEPLSDHAWEESGKFEGDLILNDRQRRLLVEDVAEGLSRNGLQDSTKRWPNNEVIYYIQREHFSGDQVDAIEEGINDLAQVSCIKFRPYKKGDRDAVVIQGSRRGCFSQVGYQGGYQVLNLSGRHPVGRGCFRHGTVVHELLHSLGFYHMQSSPDRDDYINVLWENIIEPAKHNFRKYNSFSVSDFGVGYDYDSVLHYSRRAFSANGGDTLVPKQSGASIGQRRGLSDKDTQKLNKMYCDADSNNDELSEDTTQKAAPQKKSSKNKPFEGHGIGYHQGKTVVIKLPAAETYKLPQLPTFHVFDYFSKAPQAVSPTLADDKEKEIEYTYSYPATSSDKNHANSKELQDKTDSIEIENQKNNESDAESYPNDYYKKDTKTSPIVNENINTEENVKASNTKDSSPEFHEPNYHDLHDAFERLGKIIKTHVYPSQIPNLDIYKPKLDYSKWYNHDKNLKTDPEIEKVDKAFHSSFLAKETEAKLDDSKKFYKPKLHYSEWYNHDKNLTTDPEIEKVDKAFHPSFLAKETEAKIDDSKELNSEKELDEKNINVYHRQYAVDELPPTSTINNKPIINEYSLYGTTYPLNTMYKVNKDKLVTPPYATRQHLKHKHNYSNLYHPDQKSKNTSDFYEKPKTFSDVAPIYDDWYKSDDIEYNNDKYNPESYLYSSLEEGNSDYEETKPQTQKLSQHKFANSDSPLNKQVNKLFGILVPLAHNNWYKIDYNPYKESYSIEKSKSNENLR